LREQAAPRRFAAVVRQHLMPLLFYGVASPAIEQRLVTAAAIIKDAGRTGLLY
jgi:hypothetical protein